MKSLQNGCTAKWLTSKAKPLQRKNHGSPNSASLRKNKANHENAPEPTYSQINAIPTKCLNSKVDNIKGYTTSKQDT